MTTYRFIQAEEANHAVRRLCSVLKVSRSAYIEWRGGVSHRRSRDIATEVAIKSTFRKHLGRYGAPRITVELRAKNQMKVNRKRVARVMRELGLVGRPRRKFRGSTTDSTHELPVAPNLLDRKFTASAPNQVIVGDITYLPTRSGWVYLAVLMDLFSRKVVGWAMDTHMETELCLRAFDRMRSSRGSLIGARIHHDRGSQYASHAYRKAVEAAGMTLSMSRKGNCWDNAVAESFFGTLEQELSPDELWADLTEAREAVSNYIHKYYNTERRHSTIGYMSPTEFENHHKAAWGNAA